MNHKFLKTLVFFSILTLSSCAKKIQQPYIISNYLDIQQLEEYDHKSCANLKLNFDKSNIVESKLYWHCRLSFSKYHLEINPVFPRQQEFNQKISDLIAQISIKISRNQETNIEREINKIDEKDHRQCNKMGYYPDAKDQAKIEEYYLCRKNLIELNYSELPFGNQKYAEYQNKSYNIAFVIDKRIKESIKQNQEKLEKYPECSNFRTYSDEFEKCVKSLDLYKNCITESNIKILDKEGSEKIICQKQAYIRFNDEMIKNDERVDLEIINRNKNSDKQNKNNFESIGINEKDFIGKAPKKKDEKKLSEQDALEDRIKKWEEERAEENKIKNNSDNIYSKHEIAKLRREFISSCLKIIDADLSIYKKNIYEKCEKIKYLN
jgi:hypothetical protein